VVEAAAEPRWAVREVTTCDEGERFHLVCVKER
jgi:hypothetical protein